MSLDAVRNPTILSLVLGLTLGDWRDVTGTDLRKVAGCYRYFKKYTFQKVFVWSSYLSFQLLFVCNVKSPLYLLNLGQFSDFNSSVGQSCTIFQKPLRDILFFTSLKKLV